MTFIICKFQTISKELVAMGYQVISNGEVAWVRRRGRGQGSRSA